jgi:hypothetical protein
LLDIETPGNSVGALHVRRESGETFEGALMRTIGDYCPWMRQYIVPGVLRDPETRCVIDTENCNRCAILLPPISESSIKNILMGWTMVEAPGVWSGKTWSSIVFLPATTLHQIVVDRYWLGVSYQQGITDSLFKTRSIKSHCRRLREQTGHAICAFAAINAITF